MVYTELIEDIESMQGAPERQRTTKIEQLLIDMKGKLEHRSKLIKIADRSKFGWLTVAEYEKDNLASVGYYSRARPILVLHKSRIACSCAIYCVL